ncbi:hypothetical protein [Sphingomonas sp. LaA6.9]|uniref:hypothetical protein n=1 Tax=Sphingomonas sp. LaA6.9 TaxID=2919914 RepID=UPI001F4F843D|nr:hypothetical protein [Sphingomonas sp. LaA6.9]MCJ8159904.1 hypothetical protein [Sphingomonas sp. LaA6.9]
MRGWTAADWRKFLGILFLGGGGIACTVLTWRSIDVMAVKSSSPWPIAYVAYGCIVLIGIVLLGFSAILGRRVFKIRAGDREIDFTGEDAATQLEEHLQ